MTSFIDILTQIKEIDREFDDADNLNSFFGMFKHFNMGHEIKTEVKTEIESFMKHKWQTDKNNALQSQSDKDFLQ